jgi:GDPmannose 4,6-dehydratase
MTVQDSKRRVALLTGVTGQDGAYLAEYLLGLGYAVHGVKRRSSSFNTARIDHLYEDPHAGNVPFLLHYGDMTDSTNLIRLMQQIRPTEIYNRAAHPLRSCMDWFRRSRKKKPRRSIRARPMASVNYREAYGIFASNGILFNHESPIRGETFVTRKISRGVARPPGGRDRRIQRRDQLRPFVARRRAEQIA